MASQTQATRISSSRLNTVSPLHSTISCPMSGRSMSETPSRGLRLFPTANEFERKFRNILCVEKIPTKLVHDIDHAFVDESAASD